MEGLFGFLFNVEEMMRGQQSRFVENLPLGQAVDVILCNSCVNLGGSRSLHRNAGHNTSRQNEKRKLIEEGKPS
jgi:hypothetical protein